MSDSARTEAASIVKLCVEAGVPSQAPDFLAEGLTLAQVQARVSKLGTVVEMMTIACRKEPSIPADLGLSMLAEGSSVEAIRAELFGRIVAKEEETSISGSIPLSDLPPGISASRASMERTLRSQGLTPRAAQR